LSINVLFSTTATLSPHHVILLAQQFEAEALPNIFKHLVISDTGKK
jgi:hypothetical protein